MTTASKLLEGFTIGADPELFIVDKDGNPVSAEGLIPGTKAEPYPVKFGAVQRDGFAAEFNIDPADNFADFNRNITAVIGQMKAMLPEGHKLAPIPFVRWPEDVFNAAADDVKELGCSPDVNAWTGELNPPPGLEDDPYLRCAGGHIHIGWTHDASLADAQHLMNCRDVVQQLDWYLGSWSCTKDPDPTRRRLYGCAGACRYKPYGVEYRVLSNFWVMSTSRRLAVWNRLCAAIKDVSRSFVPERVSAKSNKDLQRFINNGEILPKFKSFYAFPITTLDSSYRRF